MAFSMKKQQGPILYKNYICICSIDDTLNAVSNRLGLDLHLKKYQLSFC